MDKNLVCGLHVVRMLLTRFPERILELYCLGTRDDKRMEEIQILARRQGLKLHNIGKREFDSWFPDMAHQGVGARVKGSILLAEPDLPTLVEQSEGDPFILALDGIQDPHNLGACLRTADAANVTAVIMPKDRSVGITPVVRKVASGATETVPIVQVTNLTRSLITLKELGLWVIGTAVDAKQSLYQTDLKGPVVMVLGAEGVGLRRLTADTCDLLVTLPMYGTVESLNVSVATGICLYEVLRQRKF